MIPKAINICGIQHNIKVYSDDFTSTNIHFGEMDYKKCEIRIADNMPEELQMQTIIHEWLHGAFWMLGLNELTSNEQLVQGLAMAIYQTFAVKCGEFVCPKCGTEAIVEVAE